MMKPPLMAAFARGRASDSTAMTSTWVYQAGPDTERYFWRMLRKPLAYQAHQRSS